MADKYQKEDASGSYQLEDGSGSYLLEQQAIKAIAGFHAIEYGLVKWPGLHALPEGPVSYQSKATVTFVCDAVTFDGTNDYLTRGAGLTGAADGPLCSVSFWIKTTSISFQHVISSSGNEAVRIAVNGDGNFVIGVYGPDEFLVIGTAVINDGGWHHVAAAVNSNFSAGNKEYSIFIDGSADTASYSNDVSAAFDIDFTATEWGIGAKTDATQKLDGDLAELWMSSVDQLDWAADLTKFRSATGKPVDLGSDGSTPTGSQPIIYLHLDDGETANNFATNAGGGGGMTVNGALATAGTSPSD